MENSKRILKLVDLRAFRMMNELSQREVAEFLDVSITFISMIERGLTKLPPEKLVQLLENDRNWDTAPLIGKPDEMRIHNDHRNIAQNIEGEFNAPVHNNNYNGYSEEEFNNELKRRTELKDYEITSLRSEIIRLRQDLQREKALNEKLVGIIEKGTFKKNEEPEDDSEPENQ